MGRSGGQRHQGENARKVFSASIVELFIWRGRASTEWPNSVPRACCEALDVKGSDERRLPGVCA